MRRIIANIFALFLCCSLANAGQLSLLGAGGVAGAAPPGVTFDPANKGTSVALSNGNLTATVTTSSFGMAISSTTHSTGTFYVEYNSCTGTGSNNAVGAGHIDTTGTYNSFLGNDTHSVGWYNTGAFFYSGSQQGTDPSFSNGCFLGVAYNITSSLFWDTSDCTTWNTSSTTANVAAGVGGHGMVSGAVHAAVALDNVNSANASITANFAGPFHCSSAYTTLQGSGYTTW
jgi:hypothetical protein